MSGIRVRQPKRPEFELQNLRTPGLCRTPPGTGEQPEKLGTDRFSLEMPIPTYPEPGGQPPGARARPVTPVNDRYTFGILAPADLGPARQSPGTGTQPVMDRFAYKPQPRTRTRSGVNRVRDEWPDMPNSAVPYYGRLLPKTEECDSQRSPEADLMDRVAHLQLEVEALKFVQSAPPALAKRTLPALSKPVAFTSTKVPKFSGETSWDQYHQVFDVIVRSNVWVALQLLSHLEGDALNVTLLIPEVEQGHASRTGGGIDRTL